ncbi:hypothetical protein QTP88_002435 [Uroleucon formosanum]
MSHTQKKNNTTQNLNNLTFDSDEKNVPPIEKKQESDVNIIPAISSSSNLEEVNPPTRKCKCLTKKWKKNVMRKNKNSGLQYENYKKQHIDAKSMRGPCSTNCRIKCTSKIIEEQRKCIFEDFWNLGNLSKQRDFVNLCNTCESNKNTKNKTDEIELLQNLHLSEKNRKQKQKGKPYTVKEMSTEDFFNLKYLSKDIATNIKMDVRMETCTSNFNSMELKKAYDCPPEISAAKKSDLLKLLPMYVPQ